MPMDTGSLLRLPSGVRLLHFVRSAGDVRFDYHDDVFLGLRAIVCLKSNVQLVPNGNAYDLSMTPTVTAKVTEIVKVADGKDNYSIEDLFNIERSR